MNIEVEKATEAVKEAQKDLCKKVCQAYPLGAEVLVELGGNLVRLRVTGIPNLFWSTDGKIRGVNVKTGKTRAFYDREVVEVIKP
ncbi:hypothetical protein [Pseudomonas extremaustralis]|uniref:hypothetical protein n=1 Tax=Pseudomonas extremaustralis TaxID=359110 RepID=UPI0028640F6C|nr:hypothetical protein [Pseudomonas extremaustralis]MDR6580731.1 hypothetical protein [Pseudomonas extremaustralis]